MYCLIFIAVLIVLLFLISLLLYTKIIREFCKCSNHLVGKVVVVTGGNAGIGYETAKDLADRGARVILACRNEQRGVAARDKIIADTGNTDVHFRQLDLASFKSVKAFANAILNTEKRLDILLNNAGIRGTEYKETEDGLIHDMQSNHFGPFLLTSLLLPLLKSSAPSRIINVSSIAHKMAKLDLDNINFSKKTYDGFSAYCNSKLCNILMTAELAKQLKGTGVTANSLHPGAIYTSMIQNGPLFKYIPQLILKLYFKTPWEGAQTSIYLAVSSEVEGISGYYYDECRQARPSYQGQDEKLARKLWELSENVVKLN